MGAILSWGRPFCITKTNRIKVSKIKIKMKKLEELKSTRNKLYIKALKQVPNSPIQLKTREEIEKINDEIKVRECFSALRG